MGIELFISEEIRRFLKAVDRLLQRPFDVEIIGGAAGMLSMKLESATEDIDTTTSVREIEGAIREAREETGLNIPMGIAGIWDGPNEYSKRRRPVRIPGMRNLHIFVPEKHDWALMKIVGLRDKDRMHIMEVANHVGFDPDIFLKRFLEEMTSVIGRPSEIMANFMAMMTELFGPDEAARMERIILSDKRWQQRLREQ